MKQRKELESDRTEQALSAERLDELRAELGNIYPELLYMCRLYIPYETPNFKDAVKNLTHETVVRALGSLDTYNGNKMKPWLSEIARNTATDMFRRQRTESYPDRNPLRNEPLDNINPIDPYSLNPEEQLDNKRNEALVEEALKSFPEEQQEIWHLKREGIPVKEISSRVQMNENTVKVALFRIRKALPGIIRELQQQKQKSAKTNNP